MQVARRTLIAASLSALALSAIVLPAQAEDKWPSKPITYVVPFPAGGRPPRYPPCILCFETTQALSMLG